MGNNCFHSRFQKLIKHFLAEYQCTNPIRQRQQYVIVENCIICLRKALLSFCAHFIQVATLLSHTEHPFIHCLYPLVPAKKHVQQSIRTVCQYTPTQRHTGPTTMLKLSLRTIKRN